MLRQEETWVGVFALNKFDLLVNRLVQFHEQFAKPKYQSAFTNIALAGDKFLDFLFRVDMPREAGVQLAMLLNVLHANISTIILNKKGQEKHDIFLKICGEVNSMMVQFQVATEQIIKNNEDKKDQTTGKLKKSLKRKFTYAYFPSAGSANLRIIDEEEVPQETKPLLPDQDPESSIKIITTYNKEDLQEKINQLRMHQDLKVSATSLFAHVASYAPKLTMASGCSVIVAISLVANSFVRKRYGEILDTWAQTNKTGVGYDAALGGVLFLVGVGLFLSAVYKSRYHDEDNDYSRPLKFERV